MPRTNTKYKKRMRGIGLVEVLVGAAIISFVLIGSVSVLQLYAVASRANIEKTQAAYLLEEGVEAVRSLRDESWLSNIALLTESMPYYLVFESGKWKATTTRLLFDSRFERRFRLYPVYRRNSDEDIVDFSSAEAKTLDLGTIRVVTDVAWSNNNSVPKTAVLYEGGTTDADIPGSQFPNSSGFGDPAQSFTTLTDSITVSSVELYLSRVGTPSNAYLEIRDAPDGVVLATSDTIDSAVDILDTSLSWVTFTFPTAPTLPASTKYYIRLRSNPDSVVPFSGAQSAIHWAYGFPGGYTGGEAYRFVGVSTEVLGSYDFSFRVVENTDRRRSVEAVTYLTDLFSN